MGSSFVYVRLNDSTSPRSRCTTFSPARVSWSVLFVFAVKLCCTLIIACSCARHVFVHVSLSKKVTICFLHHNPSSSRRILAPPRHVCLAHMWALVHLASWEMIHCSPLKCEVVISTIPLIFVSWWSVRVIPVIDSIFDTVRILKFSSSSSEFRRFFHIFKSQGRAFSFDSF